jgi:hypothetical protein
MRLVEIDVSEEADGLIAVRNLHADREEMERWVLCRAQGPLPPRVAPDGHHSLASPVETGELHRLGR